MSPGGLSVYMGVLQNVMLGLVANARPLPTGLVGERRFRNSEC
jgi:hypothetical protein